ncbi:MAG TPA: DUF6504 family protein [Actinomycetota bacterium]|nr:DUF6504 family protein [Actinomycetota bacterium]
MSKRYDEAIEVTPDRDTQMPLSFSWRGRRYEIDQQLASWREGAEWWQARDNANGSSGRTNGSPAGTNGGRSNGSRRGPKDRDCFRVLARRAGVYATGELDPDGFMAAAPAAVYDLVFDRIKRSWLLSRIWD